MLEWSNCIIDLDTGDQQQNNLPSEVMSRENNKDLLETTDGVDVTPLRSSSNKSVCQRKGRAGKKTANFAVRFHSTKATISLSSR